MITRSKSKSIIENKNKNKNKNKILNKVDINFDYSREDLNEHISLYNINIDFDDSSKAWRENKLSIGNGNFRYLCKKRGRNNNLCIKNCLKGEEYCYIHSNMSKKDEILT